MAVMAVIRILIINPNSSQLMTDALRDPVETLGYNNTEYTFFTGPSDSPASINSPADALASAHACLPHILPLLPAQDAVLIACYSPHPLVPLLKAHTTRPVTGILEASTLSALALLRNRVETDDPFRAGEGEAFGVVSTADGWKQPLEDFIVRGMLDQNDGLAAARDLFGGVVTCGLSAGELHEAAPDEVERRVKAAARDLLDQRHTGTDGVEVRVGVLVLGCAGMVGMEDWVREVGGAEIRVVDGVRAGVGLLQGLARGRF